jgi:hypothetical protein
MTTSERDFNNGNGPGAGGPPAPGAGTELPEPVQRIAQERGLGPLVDVRREVSMTRAIGMGIGAAVGALVLMMLLGFLGEKFIGDNDIGAALARPVALALLFALIWGIVTAVRGLLVGSRAHYLFAGGLVAKRRTGLVAVGWPQIEQLESRYNRKTRDLVGYRVHAPGGVTFMVPLVLTAGRDPFIDRIADQVRAHGRPVR